MERASDTRGRAALDAALSRLGLEIDDCKRALLLQHLDLLIEMNEHLNLTRITGIEDAVVLHIEDSLSVWREFSHSDGEFCDLGTGGGFPGIPLGIASGRQGVLLDSVKKKAVAVQGFIDTMGLDGQLEACGLRSEELAEDCPGRFQTVVVRAVSSLPAVEELATPMLAMGGRLIAMRGTETDEQVEQGSRAAEMLGLDLVSSREFDIGDGAAHRSVYLFERVREPEMKLPRRVGLAQKRPLG